MRADAEKALLYMDGAQIDGNVVRARFTLPPRPKVSPPPKAVPVTSRREAPQRENVGADVEKDGQQRQKESPRRKPLSPPRRRSPIGRRGESPRRRPVSPLRRRVDSPPRRRVDSPHPRGETPPRRRPASPRRRSPSPAPRKNRSPARASPRRVRGSPARKRSPIPPREGVHLTEELAALQGDHHLYATVAAHQFVGLLVHVQDQFLLAGVEDRLKDVEGPAHPTLNHQVLARVSGRYPEVVLQEGPGEEEAVAIAAVAVPLLLDPISACV
ncbi:serine/arginine-rich splicing factor SR45 isoform X2 [Cinnamomum micranthum f. kanehirae]|uniref:Serine/arginine-rich splicing factor SR45 isoform X2 n=1 Tax=Cinnamomum micranthum f. kanehirae TaxID=337451 RepID=A0A443P3J9_9MAGN|nr:serine/arginine-rich splicing factor SR45 isoform X2 [Cinnamomum micranthum f. kanehirae]